MSFTLPEQPAPGRSKAHATVSWSFPEEKKCKRRNAHEELQVVGHWTYRTATSYYVACAESIHAHRGAVCI